MKDGIYRGIAVKFLSFDMTLNNSASVKVYMYLMDEYGVINNGDEAIAVMPGRCTCMTSLNSATSIHLIIALSFNCYVCYQMIHKLF